MLCLLTVVLSFLIALLLNKTFFGRGLLRVNRPAPLGGAARGVRGAVGTDVPCRNSDSSTD